MHPSSAFAVADQGNGFFMRCGGRELMTDPRVEELEALAASGGFGLPMPIRMILWFKDHDFVVDLATGKASRPAVEMPTLNAKAVAYLLANHVGEFAL